MTSSVMLPLVMEKEPRAQKCRPPALAQFRKLLCTRCDERAHEVAERNRPRDFHQHMDMFSRQHAEDDLYAQVFALAAQAVGEP